MSPQHRPITLPKCALIAAGSHNGTLKISKDMLLQSDFGGSCGTCTKPETGTGRFFGCAMCFAWSIFVTGQQRVKGGVYDLRSGNRCWYRRHEGRRGRCEWCSDWFGNRGAPAVCVPTDGLGGTRSGGLVEGLRGSGSAS